MDYLTLHPPRLYALPFFRSLLGVNHFYNLFESYFDDLFTGTKILSENDRKQSKQALLRWAKIIKNLRDPVLAGC